MSLLCRLKQHRFAQEIVAGKTIPSVLSQHLTRCAACRHACEQMQRLHKELGQTVLLPAASEAFGDTVRARILIRAQMPQKRPMPKTAIALSGAAVLLLSVMILRSTNQQTKPKISVIPAVIAPKVEKPLRSKILLTDSPQKKSLHSERITAKTVTVRSRNRLRTVRRNRVAFVPHHRSRRTAAFHEKPKPMTPLAPLVSPEIRSQQWAQWANYCENHGDFPRAADAYAHAYDTLPTEGAAFSAGQAAENAGDVSQAVLYYSHILRQPLKQKPQTEKGTFRWNSERDAA